MKNTATPVHSFLNLHYKNKPVRTFKREDGTLWWVAKDVCEVLGIANHKDAISTLDDDEKNGVGITDSMGREQRANVINEPGLYSLIIRSNKPEAKQFKRWITHDILPVIRKTGSYSIESSQEVNQPRALPEPNKTMDPVINIHIEINVGKKAAPEFYDPNQAWEHFKDHVKYFDPGDRGISKNYISSTFLFDFFNIVGDKNAWLDGLVRKYKLLAISPNPSGRFDFVSYAAAEFIYRVEYARMQEEKERIYRGELEGPIILDIEVPDGENFEFFANRHLKTRAVKLLSDIYKSRKKSLSTVSTGHGLDMATKGDE